MATTFEKLNASTLAVTTTVSKDVLEARLGRLEEKLAIKEGRIAALKNTIDSLKSNIALLK